MLTSTLSASHSLKLSRQSVPNNVRFFATQGQGRLANKVAAITGGGSGIGRESSLLFAREGASVIVADLDEAKGQEVVQEIVKAGGKAKYLRVDVSKAKDNEHMIATAEKEFGKVNVLFLNAGISHADDDNAMTTEEEVGT